jgi:hypothetical protein
MNIHGRFLSNSPNLEITLKPTNKRTEKVQLIEHLPSKLQTLSSTPTTTKRYERERKRQRRQRNFGMKWNII